MKVEMVLGIIRHILTTAGGILVTQGRLTSEQVTTGSGAVAILVGIVWSVMQKKKTVTE